MNNTGVDPFTPSRLVLARDRRGVTQRRLAELTGVTDRAIKGYEAGQRSPSHETLSLIAERLGFPFAFFQGPELEGLELEAASFRALSKASAQLRNRAVSAGTLALDLHRFLSERFELPCVDLPDLRNADPARAADTIRYEWGLGQRPISNVVHLVERHGVRVFSLSEDCSSIDAFSLWRDGIPFMFLNTRKTAERSIFDAAHELGHLVLHRHGPPQGHDAERDADQFASNLLLPEAAVRASAPRLATIATLTQLKTRWRASVAALAYRLHALGLISNWNYRSLNIELARRGRENEPAPLSRETSAVLRKTFAALAEEGLTLREIARDLRLPIGELRALSFGVHAIEDTNSEPPSGTNGPRASLRLVT